MKTHSKSNNFIAILIAVILFAIGFLLYFMHEQSQSSEQDQLGQIKSPVSLPLSILPGHFRRSNILSGRVFKDIRTS